MKYMVRCAILVALLSLLGCGFFSSRAQVKGKVTVAGKGPLSGGAIQFVLVSDPTVLSGGQIQADGSYMVPDAPVGDCKVIIDNGHLKPGGKKPAAALPPGMMGGQSQTPPDGGKPKSAPPKGVEVIPGSIPTTTGMKYIPLEPSYASADSTPLKHTVTRGDNTADFEVK